MVAKPCKCNPKDVIPSRRFYAKGKVDVFYGAEPECLFVAGHQG